ncbi:MAG TPA: heme exporter protein CcmB [Candidatus Marinimicrobia bacterium]|nr:heme exporter protein CcmB [Candidatus Neomarinimicrobiota bacterium]|tara:strand:+ start:142 stop:804 length:663 start_codon:yes stop_codon:yes gene_type:complete
MIIKLIKNEFFLEIKSSNNLFYMTFFALSCLMLSVFSFPPSAINETIILSGFFWIIVALVSIKLIENSFIREKEGGIYDLMYTSPVDNYLVFLAKLITFSLILLGVQLFIFMIYSLISTSINIDLIFKIIILCVVSNIGLIGLGMLIYLMTSLNSTRSFLFPLILFPMIVPILIHSSNLFIGLCLGLDISFYTESIMLLLTFALMAVVLGINFFERLIKY